MKDHLHFLTISRNATTRAISELDRARYYALKAGREDEASQLEVLSNSAHTILNKLQPPALAALATKKEAPVPKTHEHEWTYTNYGRSCCICGVYQDV